MFCVDSVMGYEGSAGFLPITRLSMGDLIQLSERIADRSRPTGELARFFFALDDPLSYLAAERVERALGPIEWVPVLGPLSEDAGTGPAAPRTLAGGRAHGSSPNARPQRWSCRWSSPTASRWTRAHGGSRRHVRAPTPAPAPAFSMALMRLAFCGGFDIGSVPVIEEAAAVAGLSTSRRRCAPRRDQRLDLRLDATSRGLGLRGVKSPPAISVGTHWFEGPNVVISALAFSAAHGLRTSRCSGRLSRLSRQSSVGDRSSGTGRGYISRARAGSGPRGSTRRSCPRGSGR